MLVMALTPHIGYEEAAKIAKAAHTNSTTPKKEILKNRDVTEEQIDEWLRPENMI